MISHSYLSDHRSDGKDQSGCTDGVVQAGVDRGTCVYALPQHPGAYWYPVPPPPHLDASCPQWNTDYYGDPRQQQQAHHRRG